MPRKPGWTSTSDKLPPLNQRVLGFGEWGHKIEQQIISLHDTNGDDGYVEVWAFGDKLIRIPNKPFPNNLKWNIGGHWRDFNLFTYWMPLPQSPINN